MSSGHQRSINFCNVLYAAIALDEFTRAQWAAAASVARGTLDRIIAREALHQHLEETGTSAQESRGRPSKVYRLTEAGSSHFEARLKDMLSLQFFDAAKADSDQPMLSELTELDVADDYLKAFSKEAFEDQRYSLTEALRYLRRAEQRIAECNDEGVPVAEAVLSHKRTVAEKVLTALREASFRELRHWIQYFSLEENFHPITELDNKTWFETKQALALDGRADRIRLHFWDNEVLGVCFALGVPGKSFTKRLNKDAGKAMSGWGHSDDSHILYDQVSAWESFAQDLSNLDATLPDPIAGAIVQLCEALVTPSIQAIFGASLSGRIADYLPTKHRSKFIRLIESHKRQVRDHSHDLIGEVLYGLEKMEEAA